MKPFRQKQAAFTLVELMVTVVIAGILMSIGIPSFRSMIASDEVDKTTLTLLHDLKFARTKAITTGENVRLTPSDTGIAGGWTIKNNPDSDDATLLRTRATMSNNINVTLTGFDSGVVEFDSRGQVVELGKALLASVGCIGGDSYLLDILPSGQIISERQPCEK